MPTGQPELDSSSFRLFSQVTLVWVKVTVKPKQDIPWYFFMLLGSDSHLSRKNMN